MERQISLAHIDAVVRDQLQRLDTVSGVEYLAEVSGFIKPLQERFDSARNELLLLMESAAAAEDTHELRLINDRTVAVACELFVSMKSVPIVQELCSSVRDAIAERVLELARQELYFSGTDSERTVALLSVGSDGRKEQTLLTDQDYLFLLSPGNQDSSLADNAQDDYFGMLGSAFSIKMEEAGISRCSGGIMPVNEDWRGSLSQWHERLTTMFRFERDHWDRDILNLIALMDIRFICGDRDLGLGFGNMVRSRVRDNPQAIRQMARVVSSMKLSKGFLRRFIIEAEGSHKGEFNIKILAWMPLVMCIRLMAVDVGINETSTLDRILRLKNDGHLTDKMAAELTRAYHVITGHRITQQMKRLKRIIDDDCYINPYELSTQEQREELRNAIGRIEELQSLIRGRFAMSASVDNYLSPRR
ncbi:MAG: putative nucleotidyltransferase substrate binding domain-containing protein [Desulfuromonadaceae bacterium]|nr:putative nucleotidyltransferase substrate binding domain-containing protein [Desulfuromonadaceae bacterium]